MNRLPVRSICWLPVAGCRFIGCWLPVYRLLVAGLSVARIACPNLARIAACPNRLSESLARIACLFRLVAINPILIDLLAVGCNPILIIGPQLLLYCSIARSLPIMLGRTIGDNIQ